MHSYADIDKNRFLGNGGTGFRVQSHTQNPAATHFCNKGGRPHLKMAPTVVALFA